jgi:hypothetical protein
MSPRTGHLQAVKILFVDYSKYLIMLLQLVKIGNIVSSWTTRSGGMPQGTWLGPMLVHTLASSDAEMQLVADQVADWPNAKFLNVNVKKTKETLMSPIAKLPPLLIALLDQFIERSLQHIIQAVGCFSYQ